MGRLKLILQSPHLQAREKQHCNDFLNHTKTPVESPAAKRAEWLHPSEIKRAGDGRPFSTVE
jgi:hypothetical protein